MPLVLADLDVPSASLRGEVTVGKPTVVELGLRHQHGSPAAAFTTAKLEISYDGHVWTDLALTRAGDGKYTATVTHPIGRAGQWVHLRVGATDANGGRLDQLISRAHTLVR